MSLLMHRRARTGVIAFTGIAALGGLGAGIGVASASTTAHHATKVAKHHKVAGLLARADHATVEVKVKGHWVTYDLDRGKVGAVSSSSITLDRPDGTAVTLSISASTKFKGVASESAVVVGHNARVLSESGSALRIAQASGTSASGTTTTT